MSARTLIVDAGGTTRQTKRWALVDAGGTTRLAKRVFLVDAGGTSRLIFSGADNLSMVNGTAANAVGYVRSAFGSLTPSILGDGTLVNELTVANSLSPTPHECILLISGYPGTITSVYLTSLQLDGLTPLLASSATFSGGGAGASAQWTWTGVLFLTVGATIPVAITRT